MPAAGHSAAFHKSVAAAMLGEQINGSTCARACGLHHECAHGRAAFRRADGNAHAYRGYDNTFRFTS